MPIPKSVEGFPQLAWLDYPYEEKHPDIFVPRANLELSDKTIFPNFLQKTFNSELGVTGAFFVSRQGSDVFNSHVELNKGLGWGVAAVDNVKKAGQQGAPGATGSGDGDQSNTTGLDRGVLYELEIDNLRVRNKLSANEMLFQQMRAVNGTLVISSTGKIKKAEVTANIAETDS